MKTLEYNDMDADLRLCPGGKLYYRRWFTDGNKGNGRVFDVTDKPLGYLMYDCEFDSQITLRDVFQFIEAHIDVLEPILRNHIREFIAESKKPYEDQKSNLEFLELYWFIDADPEFGTETFAFPSFHGIGKNGEKYGLDFSSVNRFMDLPLVLKKDAEVLISNSDTENSIILIPKIKYSLIGILYGIVWELSFFGTPQNRDEVEKMLLDSILEH